jgi:hypothetical protein
MEAREARCFELVKAARNDTAKPPQVRLQDPMRTQGDAVHQDVTTTKRGGVIDHLLHGQPDRRVKRGQNGTRAHASHHIDWHPRSNDAAEHSQMSRPA